MTENNNPDGSKDLNPEKGRNGVKKGQKDNQNPEKVQKKDSDAEKRSKNKDKPTVEYGFRRVIITLTVITASLLELIDTTIVNVSLPVIRGNMGATLSEISWVVAGYAMANAIVVPMTGWLATIFGRRNYFVGSILLFTLCSYLCGSSETITQLVIFRFLQGLGGGALLATSQAVLVEIFPDEQLGFANAMFGIGAVVGPTVGPVIGGYLTDVHSWPWIFYVNIPIGILAAVLSYFLIKEPLEKMKTGKFDYIGLTLLVVGIGSLQTILERGTDEDWFATNYITILTATSILGIFGFIYWEIFQAKNPIVDLRVLKNRSTALGTLFLFILGVGLYGVLFIYPQYLQNLLGYTAYQSGISLMSGGIAALLMMPILAILLSKGTSPRLLAGIGFFLFFICSYDLSTGNLASGGDAFWGDFFWAMVLRGAATAMLFVPLTTIALNGLKGSDVAQGSGLTNMARQLGGSFGLALIATFTHYSGAEHRARLTEEITTYGPQTYHRVQALVQGFVSQGFNTAEATLKAYKVIDLAVVRNTLMQTYNSAYFYIGIFFLICIPLLLFIPKVKSQGPPPAH